MTAQQTSPVPAFLPPPKPPTLLERLERPLLLVEVALVAFTLGAVGAFVTMAVVLS